MASTQIATIGKTEVLYGRMRTAIAECWGTDECKRIADQAQAIAAYFKQIKDDETVRKFLQVKLRAWRRIGEIILASPVDKSKCESMTDYRRKVCDKNPSIQMLGDHGFRSAVKVAELPDDFFEEHAGNHRTMDSLVNAFKDLEYDKWAKTPEGREEIERESAQYEAQAKANQERHAEHSKTQAQREAEASHLRTEADKAFEEVGFTLERRYRQEMHATVFLLKKEVHEILRRAAFEKRATMQAILRSGLLMWFIAHGYEVGASDMAIDPEEEAEKVRRRR